jgi:hypothetical protein
VGGYEKWGFWGLEWDGSAKKPRPGVFQGAAIVVNLQEQNVSLQIDDPHYELKGIRVDSSNTNYNGGLRSTGFSTGVAKKELNIVKLMMEKTARLDRDTFAGVDGAHGPWQQRLAEIGGIKPLACGQFGEMVPGLEARSTPR